MIIANEISTKHFTWNSTTGNFVAEASELPKIFNPFGNIYDDAADKGFYLVSHKTSEKLMFSFSHSDMSGEDVAGWWFTAIPRFNRKKNPKLDSIKVLIIND